MSFNYGYLVESMVSFLLLLTILYCVRLNKQLRLLKADEQTLRATIAELITATEMAERAIGGLKSTMHDGEQTLIERLERMEQLSAAVDEKLAAGEELLGHAWPHRRRRPRRRAGAARRSGRARGGGRGAGLRCPRPGARSAAAQHDPLRARIPADPDRAHGDDLPVRAQGVGSRVRRRLYPGRADEGSRQERLQDSGRRKRPAIPQDRRRRRRERSGNGHGRRLLGAADVQLQRRQR